MIEDPPLITIRRRFARPTEAQVAAFAGAPTGFVADALGGRGALDARIKPIGGPASFCGVAVTCDAGPADNLATYAALDISVPGDVIICACDGFQGTAVIGDNMLGVMRNRNLAAFVTDGMVRDIVGIRGVGLPCFASGVSPNSPSRNGPGTAGLPVVVGGVRVGPGDIVVGDEDGVVVVSYDRIAETMEKLAAVRVAEAALEARVKAGLKLPEFAQRILASDRVKEID